MQYLIYNRSLCKPGSCLKDASCCCCCPSYTKSNYISYRSSWLILDFQVGRFQDVMMKNNILNHFSGKGTGSRYQHFLYEFRVKRTICEHSYLSYDYLGTFFSFFFSIYWFVEGLVLNFINKAHLFNICNTS